MSDVCNSQVSRYEDFDRYKGVVNRVLQLKAVDFTEHLAF